MCIGGRCRDDELRLRRRPSHVIPESPTGAAGTLSLCLPLFSLSLLSIVLFTYPARSASTTTSHLAPPSFPSQISLPGYYQSRVLLELRESSDDNPLHSTFNCNPTVLVAG